MKTIIFEVSDDYARVAHYHLRTKYGKRKSVSINTLAKRAFFVEVANQASEELDKSSLIAILKRASQPKLRKAGKFRDYSRQLGRLL